MRGFKIQSFLGAVIASVLVGGTAYAGEVSISNYPLALLSQAVTAGKGDAHVLLSAGDVGHHGSLSPAALKQVHDSQFVVWFGESLEQNLTGALKDAPNAISLFEFDAFRRLPVRDVDGHAMADSFDVHIWLDPENAKAIVAALTVIHSHAKPEFRADYEANAKVFYEKMDALVAAQSQKPSRPYWAYHDAYQYLELPLNLSFKGALTPDHHLSPKASRFRTLTENRPKEVMCLASQMAVSAGVRDRLAPLNVLVRQEDMSDDDDFLSAWQSTAEAFEACTQDALQDTLTAQ
ncbi:MAG: metal ABC transporter substrate-binding protein [Moraxella sp.]|nr:metal ABC transporter substrate-binding protein [Moraxella sp.]